MCDFFQRRTLTTRRAPDAIEAALPENLQHGLERFSYNQHLHGCTVRLRMRKDE